MQLKFLSTIVGLLLFSYQNLFSQIEGLPLDLEVGYRRWAIFGNPNLNFRDLSKSDCPLGGALCIGDIRKARKGYNPPTINKFISISISPNTVYKNYQRKDQFFDRLGLGRNGIVNICYKINRMKANQEKSFILNNFYFEGAFDYLDPSGTKANVDSSSSFTNSEYSTTPGSIQCYNLTVGYEWMIIRTIFGRSIQDTKGRIMLSIQPKIFGYHVVKGSNNKKVNSLAETYHLMTDHPDQGRIDNLNSFVTTGGGIGIKIKSGYSFSNENVFPLYMYADFRLYFVKQGKLGPGMYPYFGPEIETNVKPLVTIGFQTLLSFGKRLSFGDVSGTDLNFYRNRNW